MIPEIRLIQLNSITAATAWKEYAHIKNIADKLKERGYLHSKIADTAKSGLMRGVKDFTKVTPGDNLNTIITIPSYKNLVKNGSDFATKQGLLQAGGSLKKNTIELNNKATRNQITTDFDISKKQYNKAKIKQDLQHHEALESLYLQRYLDQKDTDRFLKKPDTLTPGC